MLVWMMFVIYFNVLISKTSLKIPYRSENILVHCTVRCKNCTVVWNRDVNSSTNIYMIAKSAINKKRKTKIFM